MRRMVVLLLLLLGAGALAGGAWYLWGGGFGSGKPLTVFTWPDYFDPEVAAQFEAKYGARIEWTYFEDDNDRDARLSEKGAPDFDLVLASHKSIARYQSRGWLAKLEPAKAPNLRQIAQRWVTFIPGIEGYAAPYFWGTSGIVYRRDLVKTPITRWMQLLQPADELNGRILMQGDPREVVSSALLALGYSPNTDEPLAYQKAEKLLGKQKPHVLEYRPLVPNEKEAIVTTDTIAAAPAFNGDAMFLKKYKDTLEYVVPEEGGFLWADFWVVTRNAHNKELAHQFLDFLNQPEIAAKNSEYLAYATPNEGALKLLPKEFLDNRAIFPDDETLARCKAQLVIPQRVQRHIARIGGEVLPAAKGAE